MIEPRAESCELLSPRFASQLPSHIPSFASVSSRAHVFATTGLLVTASHLISLCRPTSVRRRARGAATVPEDTRDTANEVTTARRYLARKDAALARADGGPPPYDLRRRAFRRRFELMTDLAELVDLLQRRAS